MVKLRVGLNHMLRGLFIEPIDATMYPNVEPSGHLMILLFPLSKTNKVLFGSTRTAVG